MLAPVSYTHLDVYKRQRQSMQWKHAQSPKAKKSRSQPSEGKVVVTVFFDYQGVLLLYFKEPGVSTNSERYADSLKRLRVSIKNKRPGKLTNGVILLHDNVRPHVAPVSYTHLGLGLMVVTFTVTRHKKMKVY